MISMNMQQKYFFGGSKHSSSSWFLLQRHPGGNANASHGEATYSQVPRDGRRPSVHDLPCEASRSAKMGEGRSDRNLYAHGGAARRRNQGGDRGSAPTLGSKCRDPPGRPGEARAVGPGGQGGTGRGGAGVGPPRRGARGRVVTARFRRHDFPESGIRIRFPFPEPRVSQPLY